MSEGFFANTIGVLIKKGKFHQVWWFTPVDTWEAESMKHAVSLWPAWAIEWDPITKNPKGGASEKTRKNMDTEDFNMSISSVNANEINSSDIQSTR